MTLLRIPFTTRTADDGARVYNRGLLACYDVLIYKVLSPYVWRCNPQHFDDLYNRYMSDNHAEIGVGTGYFLDRHTHSLTQLRIGLFDLQPNCLAYTAKRLARFEPETVQCNALEPIPFTGAGFQSIALDKITAFTPICNGVISQPV